MMMMMVTSLTYIVEPEMWNAADNLMRGRDKVHCHDEGETLTERRPVVVAPCSPVNVPLAFARH